MHSTSWENGWWMQWNRLCVPHSANYLCMLDLLPNLSDLCMLCSRSDMSQWCWVCCVCAANRVMVEKWKPCLIAYSCSLPQPFLLSFICTECFWVFRMYFNSQNLSQLALLQWWQLFFFFFWSYIAVSDGDYSYWYKNFGGKTDCAKI